jgi:tetratricopeptide (TPR) repeat protein
MQNTAKEWLVRTRSGDILGPFSQRELIEELNRSTFSSEDEIAISFGRWLSAQTLTGRDSDEMTRTSTRSQTVTKSLHNTTKTGGSPDLDDLTPTPDAIPVGPARAVPGPKAVPQDNGALPGKMAPTLIAIFVVGGIWALLALLRAHNPQHHDAALPTPSAPHNLVSSSGEGESPFVRQIYNLIQAGEAQSALNQLNLYHERGPAKGDLEYLIPYSALLITEGESPQRARKFLEEVLDANPSLSLKARAHAWLGYLMLSQDEGDMGESHFLEALQLNPTDAASRFNLARAYLKQEKFSQALDYLQIAETEGADVWLVQIYKGRARAAMGNVAEAKAAFRAAVDAARDRWICYIYYGLYLTQIKDAAGAQDTMRRMLTRDPHYEVHSPAPLGYFQEKVNYAEYLSAFSKIMETAAGEEKEIGKIYISYLMTQRDDDHRIEMIADRGGGLFSKVLALKVVLDRDASADEIRLALKRLPPDLGGFGYYAYVLRADAKMRLKQFDDAQQDLQKALQLSPQSAVTHWAYASLLRKTQRISEAQNEIHNLLSYHPHYIPAIVSSHNF